VCLPALALLVRLVDILRLALCLPWAMVTLRMRKMGMTKTKPLVLTAMAAMRAPMTWVLDLLASWASRAQGLCPAPQAAPSPNPALPLPPSALSVESALVFLDLVLAMVEKMWWSLPLHLPLSLFQHLRLHLLLSLHLACLLVLRLSGPITLPCHLHVPTVLT